MRGKVYFIDIVHPILWERLTKFGYTCVSATEVPQEAIANIIKDASGIVIRSRISLSEEFLSQLPLIQFIARSGSGLENIDTEYCQEKNIVLFNSPEGNRNAVAEHLLGMLLATMCKLVKGNEEIKRGVWDRKGNTGEELDGKTVGIIGFGNNGSAFAKKLRGFDVKLMAYDKYKSGFGDHFVQEATLSAIQEQADIISFHIPENTETFHLFNAEFLHLCQKKIILLNASRGRIVDTRALVNGLKQKRVKAACLDVNEFEPSSFESFFQHELTPEFSYLLQAENVLLSPHVAGWTNESYYKLSNILADKIIEHYS